VGILERAWEGVKAAATISGAMVLFERAKTALDAILH